MRKIIFVAITIMILAFTACSNKDMESCVEDNNSSNNIITLDKGTWPENEYTRGLPVPSAGRVSWATINKEEYYCAISISDFGNSEYNLYMEELKNVGFDIVKEVSEEVEGQDYTSVGMLLSNGEKGLSISYIPNNMSIYISLIK